MFKKVAKVVADNGCTLYFIYPMNNCIISPKTHMFPPDRQLIMTCLQCCSVIILIKKR